MAANLACDKFWLNKSMYHDAEKKYHENQLKGDLSMRKLNEDSFPKTSLAGEVAKARQHIKSSLECMDQSLSGMGGIAHTPLASVLEKIENAITNLTVRVENIEKRLATSSAASTVPVSIKTQASAPAKQAKSPKAKAQAKNDDDDDEDIDLFGSDKEDEEEKKARKENLAKSSAKKSAKPPPIAKSNIILDIKPWDDETDMKEMEKAVRSIEMEGLLWGASKLVPVAFKIFKLQISCVVEDEKVSVDLLTETLEGIEDYIQSVDIAAFNKV